MNKRYMDFVPSKSTPVSRQQKVATRKQTARMASVPRKVAKVSTGVDFDARRSNAKRQPEAELGVIEDFAPKFIKTTTEKRPLNSGKTVARRATSSAARDAKAQRVGNRASGGRASGNNTKSGMANKRSANTGNSYEVPKSPFINMDKVVKRPLSKNVYQKEEKKTPRKGVKKPVAVVNRKEKDSKVGLIITIILTIILGAAAGTVAFLLLPK